MNNRFIVSISVRSAIAISDILINFIKHGNKFVSSIEGHMSFLELQNYV